METSIQEKTPTTVSVDSKATAALNPDANPFTPSDPTQTLSPQPTAPAATQQQQQQPFKPHVKYCYYEQYGQCNKGDACPFTHRANEQCWYEANGGKSLDLACFCTVDQLSQLLITFTLQAAEEAKLVYSSILEFNRPMVSIAEGT